MRNLFLVIAAIEIAALVLRKREPVVKGLLYLSAIVGLGAAAAVYRAGDLGGDLVFPTLAGWGSVRVTRRTCNGCWWQASTTRPAPHAMRDDQTRRRA